MRSVRSSVLWAACVCTVFGADGIPLSEYKARREGLHRAPARLSSSSLARRRDNGDLRTGFFQDADFYYLTGWKEPGAMLVMTPGSDVLLVPKKNAEKERWTGAKLAPSVPNIVAVTGFDAIVPSESFESRLPQWIESASKVYTLTKNPLGNHSKSFCRCANSLTQRRSSRSKE